VRNGSDSDLTCARHGVRAVRWSGFGFVSVAITIKVFPERSEGKFLLQFVTISLRKHLQFLEIGVEWFLLDG